MCLIFFPNARGFDSEYTSWWQVRFLRWNKRVTLLLSDMLPSPNISGRVRSRHRWNSSNQTFFYQLFFIFKFLSGWRTRARPASWRFLRNKMPRPSLWDKLNTAKSFQQRLLNYNTSCRKGFTILVVRGKQNERLSMSRLRIEEEATAVYNVIAEREEINKPDFVCVCRLLRGRARSRLVSKKKNPRVPRSHF